MLKGLLLLALRFDECGRPVTCVENHWTGLRFYRFSLLYGGCLPSGLRPGCSIKEGCTTSFACHVTFHERRWWMCGRKINEKFFLSMFSFSSVFYSEPRYALWLNSASFLLHQHNMNYLALFIEMSYHLSRSHEILCENYLPFPLLCDWC